MSKSILIVYDDPNLLVIFKKTYRKTCLMNYIILLHY